MKTNLLISLHKEAIELLEQLAKKREEKAEFQLKIEIEENKDPIERYLTYSKSCCIEEIEKCKKEISKMKYNYIDLTLKI